MKLDKKKIVFISGILISIICSWLFARKIEWAHLNEAFREANYIYIIPTIMVIFLSHYLRAVRWSTLIAPIKKVSILNLFSATMIGFMANSVLPARVGEIIRPVVIARRENIKITTTFATVVMERIFDVLSVIVFASLLFFFLPSETSQNKRTGMINHVEASTKDLKEGQESYSSAANKESYTDTSKVIKQLKKWSVVLAFFGILAITTLFLLSVYPQKAGAVLEKLLFLFPHHLKDKLINFLHSFISGLQVLDNKKQLLWIGTLSLIIWFFNAASVYVLCYSFNIGLSFAGACFVIVCLALAVALPQAPGFIGVFHIATQKSLAIFGVGLSSAQSYAITLWALSVIPVTLVGLLFLWREGMSLGEISKYEEKVSE
ncbi:MAG: flippase-like domain-containing protein [Candidatus Scalindua sediminis]|nr:flippase-like domain-containing protein [Candidatus Scalindua sediminis]